MRKPRDFDAEMKTLNERAKLLKERKVHQLGDLVLATGGDALPIETLTGAILIAAETKDATTLEGWRKRGAAFFSGGTQNSARRPRGDARGAAASDDGTQPPASGTSTQ